MAFLTKTSFFVVLLTSLFLFPIEVFSQEDSIELQQKDTSLLHHSIKRATILSTILPGAGQVYNKKFWKVPIVYAGFATIGYFIKYNNTGYKEYKNNLIAETDDNPETIYDGLASETQLKQIMNSYRKNRDLFIILTAVWYGLNIMDAHVDAHFINFDIGDDLTMEISPVNIQYGNNNTFGINCRLYF